MPRVHRDNPGRCSIPFRVTTALAARAEQGIDRFDLVGHSMGGLTSMVLAHQHPERVASFTDIEGNVAPEGCFLSRQIFLHPHEDPDSPWRTSSHGTGPRPTIQAPLYATSVRHKVRARALRGLFESMVDLSDNADLMKKFLALPFPRMFMYGEQNPLWATSPTWQPTALNWRRSRAAATSPYIPTPRKCGEGLLPSRPWRMNPHPLRSPPALDLPPAQRCAGPNPFER